MHTTNINYSQVTFQWMYFLINYFSIMSENQLLQFVSFIKSEIIIYLLSSFVLFTNEFSSFLFCKNHASKIYTALRNADLNDSLYKVKSLLDTVAKKHFWSKKASLLYSLIGIWPRSLHYRIFFMWDSQVVYFKIGFQSTIKSCLS